MTNLKIIAQWGLGISLGATSIVIPSCIANSKGIQLTSLKEQNKQLTEENKSKKTESIGKLQNQAKGLQEEINSFDKLDKDLLQLLTENNDFKNNKEEYETQNQRLIKLKQLIRIANNSVCPKNSSPEKYKSYCQQIAAQAIDLEIV